MNKGLLISGLGHLGLVLWALLGGWFTWASKYPDVPVAQVSLISTSEFDAMNAAAPKVDDTAPVPTPQPAATTAPQPTPAPTAPPPPKPVEPEPLPTPDPAPTPDEAPPPEPPPVAPPSDTPQPIPVQPTDKAPVPDTAERIASTPVEATDQPKTADAATPEQTDTPSPDSTPVPEQPAAAPEKTVTAVTPDAKPAEDIAPQLAPTTSPRPPTRPKTLETPPEETQTAEPAPDPAATDTSAADQAAIDAALADATSQEAAATTPAPSQTGSGGTGDQPIGAALNSGEVDNLRRIIGPLWNIGSLSTEASRVTVTMRVQFSEDQTVLSVEMVEFAGGTAEAAQQAFEAAKRAVMRGASKGLGLPADKYETWKSMLFTFDTSQGRLR